MNPITINAISVKPVVIVATEVTDQPNPANQCSIMYCKCYFKMRKKPFFLKDALQIASQFSTSQALFNVHKFTTKIIFFFYL